MDGECVEDMRYNSLHQSIWAQNEYFIKAAANLK